MKLVRTIKGIRHQLYLKWFHHLPLQNNKLILWTMNFKSYGCSPKYITEYLWREYPDKFDIVWVFDAGAQLPSDLPEGIRTVRYFSIEYLRELSTAKFIICNSRTGPGHYFSKRDGQVYIQTWHSSLRLKMIERDAADALPQSYIEAAKTDSGKIDLLLAGCGFSEDIFRRAFWYDGEIMKSGTPRCDVLLNDTSTIRKKVFQHFGISENSKLVLYAPTFRNNKAAQTHGLDFSLLKDSLEQSTYKHWEIGCRFHPNLAASQSPHGSISMSAYPDMQELLAAADCLITDYSSCMFDMALTGKPCILYAPDLSEYQANERGLYFEITELPFLVARNMDELRSIINGFDKEAYQAEINQFIGTIRNYEDGNASKRVAEYIIKKSGI